MASVTVKNWQEFRNEGDRFFFVPPPNHPYNWQVPRWWYHGEQKCYTSCARVDLATDRKRYQCYIAASSPSMRLTMSYTDKLALTDQSEVCRVLVCFDLGPVVRGVSDEYIDIEYNLENGWVVRWDNIDDRIL